MKRALSVTVVVLAGLVAGACSRSASDVTNNLVGQTPPSPVRPEPPDPSLPPIEIDFGADWWTNFTDKGLNEAVSQALTFNRSLAAAASRIGAAEAQARIARAPELPMVRAGFRGGRQNANLIGLPFYGYEDEVLTSSTMRIGMAMNVSWEPDFWGKVKAGKLAAAADLDSARAGLEAAKLSLAGQTAKAWFAAVEAQLQIGVASATVESYRVSVEAARTRQAGGVRSGLDIEATLAEMKRAESILQLRRQQRDAAVRQLEILMGGYPDGDHEISEDLPPAPPPTPAGLSSQSVHRRPDLLAAEARLLSAGARVKQSRAELRPRFAFTSFGGNVTNTLRELITRQVTVWSLLGGVTQPIFDHGRLKNVVKAREAQEREATAQYESALLRAYGEVEIALAADKYLAERAAALEESKNRALKAQTIAQEQYRGGLGDVTILLSTQRGALEAESAWLSARRARLDNRIDLYLALGGDFRIADTYSSGEAR